MKRSKRIEALDRRAVNKDGFIDEWPEMGFVAMHSPYDGNAENARQKNSGKSGSHYKPEG